MIVSLCRRLFKRRRRAAQRKRQMGVQMKCLSALLPHKYLDAIEISKRTGISVAQASSSLSALFARGDVVERKRDAASAPATERGLTIERTCWHYRLQAKEEAATSTEDLLERTA